MNSNTMDNGSRLAWWDVIFGVWLIVSPFVVGFAQNTALLWNDIAVGIAVVILSFVSRGGPVKGLLVMLGAWLFAATFVFGFHRAAPAWNNLLVAFLVIIGALFSEGATVNPE